MSANSMASGTISTLMTPKSFSPADLFLRPWPVFPTGSQSSPFKCPVGTSDLSYQSTELILSSSCSSSRVSKPENKEPSPSLSSLSTLHIIPTSHQVLLILPYEICFCPPPLCCSPSQGHHYPSCRMSCSLTFPLVTLLNYFSHSSDSCGSITLYLSPLCPPAPTPTLLPPHPLALWIKPSSPSREE